MSCSPPRAATARASTGPSSRSRRRSSSTARRSTSASRSSTTSTSSRRSRQRGAIFVDETDEVPEGAPVIFSAHGVSPAVHEEAAASRPAHDRRHLPAGDQGAPRGAPLRRRRLRHPAHRPRGPRGGRGHRRRGARPHPARRRPGRRRAGRGPRPGPGRLALPDHAVGRRDDGDGGAGCASASPLLLDPPSDDICYATQNRQVAVKEIAPTPRPGDRRGLDQLVQLACASSRWRSRPVPRAAHLRRLRRRARRGLARGRHDRRRDERRLGPRGSSSTGCSTGSPSAASPASSRSRSAEESLIFALPPELRRELKAAGVRSEIRPAL